MYQLVLLYSGFVEFRVGVACSLLAQCCQLHSSLFVYFLHALLEQFLTSLDFYFFVDFCLFELFFSLQGFKL